MKKNKFLLVIILISIFSCLLLSKNIAQSGDFDSEYQKLVSRLNLDTNGLESVKQSKENPEKAAAELLKYFRARTNVNQFIDRRERTSSLNRIASRKNLIVADSALKHIFIGQSAYPPYFCGKDINWGMRPVPDNEWVWQLNRLSFWEDLAKAYWHTGDEKYAREWCFQLTDWVRKNPNDEPHAYAWRSIEAGIRGHNLTGLFEYFIDSESFTPLALMTYLNSCFDHADYLMTVYRSKSNWGLMEAEGLAFIALTFPEFQDTEKWKTEAFRRLNNEIHLQVYSDGHQRELSMNYHLGCINWFLRTYELAKLNHQEKAFPDSYLRNIEKMCEVPMKLCLPDGTHGQFGDDWEGTPGQHAGLFLEWSKKFNRPDFLFLATDGKEGKEPVDKAFAFPESGFYSMRSSWSKNAICMVLKCGPDGGGHCQPDNGTFVLYAGGRNLMPDGGSYIYSGNPEGRNWFRQSRVHQTLTLNGENIRYAPKLLLWQPGTDMNILVTENRSYKELAHRRSVFFVDNRYFILVDEAIGKASGNVDLHFQLAPGEIVSDINDLTFRSNFKAGWNVLVKTMPQTGVKADLEEGQVSFRYTQKEPRPAFRFGVVKGTEPVRFITLVAPYENKAPDIKIKVLQDTGIGSQALKLEITENGKKRQIGYQLILQTSN
ncbi:MAG: alginate lyase family protein [Prolixibacteraceae bacterium]